MPDVLTDRLLAERSTLVTRATAITQTAAEEGRDLTDGERTSLTTTRGRIGELDVQLELTTADLALSAETQARIARFNGQPVQPNPESQWRSAGHCLWDYMHQREDRESRDRVRAFEARGAGADPLYLPPSWQAQQELQTRAAQHMGTTAAATTPTAGGFGGLLVSPVVGPVIQLAWTSTPLVNAIGTRPAPNGWSFSRPRIVDPDLYTASQPQSKEKAEVNSRKFDVVADQVSLVTSANYLNLSLQAETFINSPDALDIVVAQLNARTSVGIELAAVGLLEDVTKTVTPAGDTAADLIAALYEAAALVLKATGRMPEWTVVGPDGWAKLGGTTDLAGRPIFPPVGPVNALGSLNPGQLGGGLAGVPGQLIITPGISDDSMYVGNSTGIELYLYRFPMLSAIEPSVLGRQIAVAASLGSYQPPTTEAGPGGTPAAKYEAIVKIVAA